MFAARLTPKSGAHLTFLADQSSLHQDKTSPMAACRVDADADTDGFGLRADSLGRRSIRRLARGGVAGYHVVIPEKTT
jgi:hypothetical protein